MSERNDGGPAFPTLMPVMTGEGIRPVVDGMSLRDYFAGQALAGMDVWNIPLGDDYRAKVSTHAYAIADAMLAARSKPEGGE